MALSKKPVNGMKDILPEEMQIRDYVQQVIKETYRSFGFTPIETPSHISLCILRKILLRFFTVCQLSACFRNLIDSAARKCYIINRVYCSVLSPYRYNL